MKRLRDAGDAAFEAHRWQAQQATRPMVAPEDQARELAWALMDAVRADDTTEARRLALALRPMLGLLREEGA